MRRGIGQLGPPPPVGALRVSGAQHWEMYPARVGRKRVYQRDSRGVPFAKARQAPVDEGSRSVSVRREAGGDDVSVPNMYTGSHAGCGGTVVFRPVTYRRDLLAGKTVTLSAVCRRCGEPITTEYSLATPTATASVHDLADRTRRIDVERDRSHGLALPLAVGAEHLPTPGDAVDHETAIARFGDADAQPDGPGSATITSLDEWRGGRSDSHAPTATLDPEPPVAVATVAPPVEEGPAS